MTDLEKNLKPITKWVGGKRQLLPELHKYMPTSYNNYFEPFVGGGAMLFSIKPLNATINDFNSDLINLYANVRDNPQRLLELLENHKRLNSKEYYLEVRNMDRNGKINELSSVEKAARILYMLKVDFNGMYRVNRKNQFNVPYGRYKNPKIADYETINAASKYFKEANVTFLNGDFQEAVQSAVKDDFIYFDPPYVPVNSTSNFTSYTSEGFDIADQKRLKHVFDSLSNDGVKVMLSNSDVDIIHELYHEYNIHLVQAKRHINSDSSKRGKVGEVIITNY
ncbi:DNA adenine methylase [Apilactobacillus xinyiensis]|uniref:DNA adenine methylase n=1 Tax=Apilactobacillus xinyiensis TaxID=2841032 RepID=UPI001C7D2609|nr:DNA adenine methylase [Apilactobacillus xinyiensis]